MRAVINVVVTCGQDYDCKYIFDSLSDRAEFNIVSVEKDETGAIIRSANLKPDVLIISSQLPGMDEIELAPIIHRRSPSTAIVVIRENDEEDYASRAIKAGIMGILLKEADMDKLALAVKVVYSGGYYISASITSRVFGTVSMLHYFPGQISGLTKSWLTNKTDYKFFSPAERRIIINIAQGLTDEEIAKYLHFSTGTIRNYMTAIRRKTKLKTRTQIVIYSLVYGLINFDQIDILKKTNKLDEEIIEL